MAAKVRQAAEQYGRKFYIMYDATDWTNMQSEMKTDWTNKMRAYTSSPAYAKQNGKPVVCIWGFGFNEANKAWPASVLPRCHELVQGPGLLRDRRRTDALAAAATRTRGPGYLDVYHAFNMLSPWMVGRIQDVAGADHYYNNVNQQDQADCNAHGIDYQPCVIPGDLSSGHRRHGDLMWRQFYNLTRVGVQGMYISMFDEFNEGNQIAKTAESQAWIPGGSGIRALDEDGTACSSDYYLRLTNDGGRMFKGQIPLTATRPTPPMPSQGVGSVSVLRARGLPGRGRASPC